MMQRRSSQKQVDRAIAKRARRSKNSTEEDDEQNEFASTTADYRAALMIVQGAIYLRRKTVVDVTTACLLLS